VATVWDVTIALIKVSSRQLLLICTTGWHSSLFPYPTSNWTFHFRYDRPCGDVMSTTWYPRGHSRQLRSAVRRCPAQITRGSVDVVIYCCCSKCLLCVVSTAYCFISRYSSVSLVTATPFRVGGKIDFSSECKRFFSPSSKLPDRLCSEDRSSVVGVKRPRRVLISQFDLMQKWRMSGAIRLFPLYAFMAPTLQALPSTCCCFCICLIN
jgi:hypothetical protein